MATLTGIEIIEECEKPNEISGFVTAEKSFLGRKRKVWFTKSYNAEHVLTAIH